MNQIVLVSPVNVVRYSVFSVVLEAFVTVAPQKTIIAV